MESTLSPALPAMPPAAYLGGKKNLARRIIARLGEIPHTTYVEPFIGMGGVFLRRPFRAKAEVINDISTDVANLFRILQRHYVPLMDMLRWQLTSRAEWQRLNAANPDTLTDLERAARFLYLQRLGFGGKVSGRTFGVAPTVPARFDVAKLAGVLEEVHERLSGVVIERLPYADLIRRYDRPGTLFYLDPPYWGCEGDYGDGVFSRDDFERLADQLAGLKGRFLLSLNDTPGVREVFGGFAIEEVTVSYTVGLHAARPPAREVLISGPVASS
ncbi:DNA adenine methylase [Roseomonas rosea]|uniref:site-specific DNA-methyltransferase (adenine-specific) n=1 Tax=Muricoccus roseus TaxID=198092 RepID=A0A1M6LFF1_9PROT|nr:DNA adenine methylase [Roseomonas rosea]SHJ69929.1 DNA adenine methylase [Roseomonas rosea]